MRKGSKRSCLRIRAVEARTRTNPVMIKPRRKPILKDKEEAIIKSAIDIFADECSKPLKKPTKADLRRYASMPSFFDSVTEKDREEAWKRGCII